MDSKEDPSTTTTTTDYDSGDSASVDYVYEREWCQEENKREARSPRRKTSPRAKGRGAVRCTCGASRNRARDDDEDTVFEETSSTEEERAPKKPAKKRKSSGSATAPGCHASDRHKADKPKTTGGKIRREPSPYIEEYPDEPSRPKPTIILREHKIMRRSSTSETKRLRHRKDRSSSGSRGRSPPRELPSSKPSRRFSKESPRPRRHHKRQDDIHRTYQSKSSGSEALDDFQSDSAGPDPATRHPQRRCLEPETTVSRSSAASGSRQPRYSSTWPLPPEANLRRRLGFHDHAHNNNAEEGEEDWHHDKNSHDEQQPRRSIRGPILRKRTSNQERVQDRQPSPPAARQEHKHTRPRHYPRTVVSHVSMATTDNGYHSVATSMCEVWRGDTDAWESPNTSGSPSENDDEAGIEERITLLRMEDQPPRTSSPHLLPPLGDRGDFRFRGPSRPSSSGRYRSYHASACTEEHSAGTALVPYRRPARVHPATNRILLDDDGQALTLTMEPDVMTDDEGNTRDMRLLSRASRWPRPGPPRGWTQPPPSRSRTVSPAFSARETRKLLSPKPARAERFDFGAWGCDRASRGSLTLGLL